MFDRGGLKLGTVDGITIRLHWIFLLWGLFEWMALSRSAPGSDASGGESLASGSTVIYYLIFLFASVFLHEMGHCRAARRVGGNASEVLLWPLGGLATVDIPDRPANHLAVAIGGPIVNLVLWLILLPIALYSGDGVGSFFLRMPVSDPVSIAAAVNLDLLLFNLLPAFPLDGGRILHSVVWSRQGEWKAHRTMITSGRVVSVALLLVWLTVEGASGFLLAMALMIFAQSYVMAKAATDDDREWWQGSAEPQQGWWERQKQNLRDRQEQKRELEESRKKARVDELLEKVSRDGLDSLTREERNFLEKVSREFDRRD
jgi:Zn-dependent protease